MAFFQRTLTAAVAAAALTGAFTLPVMAQANHAPAPAAAQSPHAGKHQGRAAPDFAKVHADRQERLKTLLQLQPNQQAAWEQYIKATTPEPRQQPKAEERPDLRKLTTPERLDLAQKLRKERTAQIEQHEKATRTFYNSLTPSQQKVFDELQAHRPGPRHGAKDRGHGGKGMDMRGGHNGPRGGHGPAGHPPVPPAPAA